MSKDLEDLRREPWRFWEARMTYPVGTVGTGPIATILWGERAYKLFYFFLIQKEKMNS